MSQVTNKIDEVISSCVEIKSSVVGYEEKIDEQQGQIGTLQTDLNAANNKIKELKDIIASQNPTNPDPNPDPEPEPTPDPVKDYGSFSPKLSSFVKGKTGSIDFIPGPDFPQDGIIIFQTWSDVTKTVEASLLDRNPPFIYGKDELNKVTNGKASVQALIRNSTSIVKTISMDVEFSGAVVTEPTPQPDPTPNPDPVPDPSPGTGGEEKGWTPIVKSADTRIVYVSTSGNDSNDGLSPDKPVKTLLKAYSLMRNNYPDHMLLKRGDTWKDEPMLELYKYGRNTNEKMVFASYGTGPRPRLLSTKGQFNSKGLRNFAFIDLDLENWLKNPSSTGFQRMVNGGYGIRIYGWANDVLIEGCRLRYFFQNMALMGKDETNIVQNLKLRRVVSIDAWDEPADGGMKKGTALYMSKAKNVLIEECVLDRNGWLPDVCSKTKYAHNMYLQKEGVSEGSDSFKMVRCWITRAGANGTQFREGGTLEDSVFIDNGLHGFHGGAEGKAIGNIFIGGEDINPNERRGFGWDMMSDSNTFINNIVCHKNKADVGAARASCLEKKDAAGAVISVSKLVYTNNIIWDWKGDALELRSKAKVAEIKDNILLPLTGYKPIDRIASPVASTESGNIVSGTVNFLDPNRDLITYQKSIGRTPTKDAFFANLREVCKGNWDPKLTTSSFSAYIREGFKRV